MKISPRVQAITAKMYLMFGSDTGCLAGLRPDQRTAVEVIVAFVLAILEAPTDALDRIDS